MFLHEYLDVLHRKYRDYELISGNYPVIKRRLGWKRHEKTSLHEVGAVRAFHFDFEVELQGHAGVDNEYGDPIKAIL